MRQTPPKTSVKPGTYTGQQVAIKTVGKIDLAKKKRRPIDYPVRQKLTRRNILLDNKGAVACFCVNEEVAALVCDVLNAYNQAVI